MPKKKMDRRDQLGFIWSISSKENGESSKKTKPSVREMEREAEQERLKQGRRILMDQLERSGITRLKRGKNLNA